MISNSSNYPIRGFIRRMSEPNTSSSASAAAAAAAATVAATQSLLINQQGSLLYKGRRLLRKTNTLIGYIQSETLGVFGGTIISPPLLRKITLNVDHLSKWMMHADLQEIEAWLTMPDHQHLEVSVYADPRVWAGQICYQRKDIVIEIRTTYELGVYTIIFRPAEFPTDYQKEVWEKKYTDSLPLAAMAVVAEAIEAARRPGMARLTYHDKQVGCLLIPNRTKLEEIAGLLQNRRYRRGYHDLRHFMFGIREENMNSSNIRMRQNRSMETSWHLSTPPEEDEEPLPRYCETLPPRYSTVISH